MKESQISREIDRFLTMIGGTVYSLEQGYRKERGGTRQTPGIPDKFVCFPSERVWTWAEIKTAKGQLTTRQEGFRLMCEEAGIPWQLWRDVTDAFDWCLEHGLIEEQT